MNAKTATPKIVKILSWIARIWSLLVLLVALMIAFSPDENATAPVPVADWFLLSLWGVAVLGLLIAWRWRLAGGILTIAVLFIREIAWIILKGHWMVNFLIVWVFMVPPAILFILAWVLQRKARLKPNASA